MRNAAFLSSAAALLLSVAPIVAANDFDALLGDLTFGDAPTTTESLTLDVAAEQVAETLQPVPSEASSELTMPLAAEPIATPTPSLVQGQTTIVSPQPVAISSQPVFNQPIATSQPIATNQHVDFGQAFAAQDCDSCAGGCRASGFNAGGCDAGGSYGGSSFAGCGGSDQECETCVPYHQPNLPSSSFYQYFRSNACNTDVWNGYRNRCCYASKHTRGECDCFNKDRGCNDCNTQVFDAAPYETRVCEVPSTTRTNRFFDFRKRGDCDDQLESCDASQGSCDGPSCDGVVATCD